MQPLLPSVHVARPPLMHDVCPFVQLFVQVREHWALGAAPEHVSGAAHGVVDETKAQESASSAQVATVWPSWQTVPVPVQIDAAQVHAAAPAETVHAWCVPHVLVVTQAVHPLACAWQVWTAPDVHWVAPAVQAFVQHAAVPAAPVHAPLVHGVADDAKSHPVVRSCEQVASDAGPAHVGPVPAQTGSWLHVHLAEPTVPVQL